MNRLLAYLSFQGRANRARYWLTNLLLFGVVVACLVVATITMTLLPPASWIATLLMLVIFIAALANGARRLHDRNKSAWWLLVFVGIPALLGGLRALIEASGGGEGPAGLVALVSLPFSIWALVELGILKGAAGPNRYGEDPLGEAART